MPIVIRQGLAPGGDFASSLSRPAAAALSGMAEVRAQAMRQREESLQQITGIGENIFNKTVSLRDLQVRQQEAASRLKELEDFHKWIEGSNGPTATQKLIADQSAAIKERGQTLEYADKDEGRANDIAKLKEMHDKNSADIQLRAVHENATEAANVAKSSAQKASAILNISKAESAGEISAADAALATSAMKEAAVDPQAAATLHQTLMAAQAADENKKGIASLNQQLDKSPALMRGVMQSAVRGDPVATKTLQARDFDPSWYAQARQAVNGLPPGDLANLHTQLQQRQQQLWQQMAQNTLAHTSPDGKQWMAPDVEKANQIRIKYDATADLMNHVKSIFQAKIAPQPGAAVPANTAAPSTSVGSNDIDLTASRKMSPQASSSAATVPPAGATPSVGGQSAGKPIDVPDEAKGNPQWLLQNAKQGDTLKFSDGSTEVVTPDIMQMAQTVSQQNTAPADQSAQPTPQSTLPVNQPGSNAPGAKAVSPTYPTGVVTPAGAASPTPQVTPQQPQSSAAPSPAQGAPQPPAPPPGPAAAAAGGQPVVGPTNPAVPPYLQYAMQHAMQASQAVNQAAAGPMAAAQQAQQNLGNQVQQSVGFGVQGAGASAFEGA